MKSIFRSEAIEFISKICREGNIQCEHVRSNHIDILLRSIQTAIKFHVPGEDVTIPNASESADISSNNFRIVHIWEDQWNYEQKKVESKIRSIIGTTHRIYGRETNLVDIDNTQLTNFLTHNHLNTPIKAKYKYGLTHQAKIVAVMSFSKSRQIKREGEAYNSFELLRFCNKLNVTVVGGFSKLLNHFIKQQSPDDIMTYVDADWSGGHSLKLLNFDCVEKKDPMEFWLNSSTGKREYPQLILKRNNIVDSINWTTREKIQFLEKNGYVMVVNSGSFKYILNLKK